MKAMLTFAYTLVLSSAKSFHSSLTLCDTMDCSLLNSSVHGILQTRTLEWAAMPSSRGSSWPRDWTCVSCISCNGRWILYRCATFLYSHTYISNTRGWKLGKFLFGGKPCIIMICNWSSSNLRPHFTFVGNTLKVLCDLRGAEWVQNCQEIQIGFPVITLVDGLLLRALLAPHVAVQHRRD